MSYTGDGIEVFPGRIVYHRISEVLWDIAGLFAKQVPTDGAGPGVVNAIHALAGSLLSQDTQRYINTARLTQELPSVHRLLLNQDELAQHLGVLFPVIATKASVHIIADDLAIVGGYHRSPPHQDWRSIQGSLDNVVLWIPLTPVRGNGLEVIRGSHKHGLLPTKEHIMTPEVIDPERLGPWESIDCDPGDVVAFSSFLVHRTAAGPGLRIAISTRFSNAAEPTFIERGFPSPYRYSYQRDLITPDFPPRLP